MTKTTATTHKKTNSKTEKSTKNLKHKSEGRGLTPKHAITKYTAVQSKKKQKILQCCSLFYFQ